MEAPLSPQEEEIQNPSVRDMCVFTRNPQETPGFPRTWYRRSTLLFYKKARPAAKPPTMPAALYPGLDVICAPDLEVAVDDTEEAEAAEAVEAEETAVPVEEAAEVEEHETEDGRFVTPDEPQKFRAKVTAVA